VNFAVGAEGVLTVTAREQHSGREVQTVLSTRDGAEAVRRQLAAATAADHEERSGATPLPAARAAPRTAEPKPGSGLRGLFRRIWE